MLAAAKKEPDLFRNVMVHEAAFQNDTPLPQAGFLYFRNMSTFAPYLKDPITYRDLYGICNAETSLKVSPEVRERLAKNLDYWATWYLGTVDADSYYKEDFEKMPPVSFSVGTWTPSWLVYSNIVTAERGGCPLTWFNCPHHPELVIPKELAAYLKETIEQYL